MTRLLFCFIGSDEMQVEELQSLIERVREFKYESQILEVKSAHTGCPTKLYPVLSGFSNQDDGGVILFGVDNVD